MAGPTVVRLSDALNQVVNATHGRLAAAAMPGGLLEGIRGVVKGERGEARPDPPYLWVAVGAGQATNARALHETWDLTLLVSAFVQSHEVEEGWLEAFRWAALARGVILGGTSRDLGLEFVEDVQSDSIGPLGRFTSGRRFGAFARLTVRVSLVEPA